MRAFLNLTDLAVDRLGGVALAANDDFFGEKENLLRAAKPVFIEDRYTERGQWMDGWETRRRRAPGYDWCLIRLGLPGIVRGLVIDTSFFEGSCPEQASVEACSAPSGATPGELGAETTTWTTILRKSALKGNAPNAFPVSVPNRFTHLRLNIFPDGGVARLRAHGDVVPDRPANGNSSVLADLAAVENGGLVIGASDMFFGHRSNLILPGPAVNMGDGWQTQRRRGPGHDWAILKLGAEGSIRRALVDVSHFKGNAPGSVSLEGLAVEGATLDDLVAGEYSWIPILSETNITPDVLHTFESEIQDAGPVTHVRLNIFPDGGVGRLRLFGARSRRGRLNQALTWLNTVPPVEAENAFRAVSGYDAWARQMEKGRPYEDLEGLKAAARRVFHGLGPADWTRAFGRDQTNGTFLTDEPWSGSPPGGTAAASGRNHVELSRLTRSYVDRFGFICILCASGLSEDEIAARITARLSNDPEQEMGTAEGELIKITDLGLAKLLGS